MSRVSEFSVDLDAITHNLGEVRRRAGGRDVLTAVKADAYGHGAIEVARHIEAHHLSEWLGVALVNEAVELRRSGVTLPILKLSPVFADELPEAIAADVTLTVVDEDTIDQAGQAAAEAGRVVPVHLKVDTGMRRIGTTPECAVALARRIRDAPHLALDGLFTHLPVSDVPQGADFTRQQLSAFEDVAARVTAEVGHVPHVSAANSGAVMLHDLGTTTLVRPGIMVYGCAPDKDTPATVDLRPVARWTSRLLFVKQVRAGETVGYGRTWTAQADTWVGTVEIGYGDGFSRALSNRGRMLIGGRSYPVVGRVCMDQTMVDLGPRPPDVVVGDEVVLLGRSGDEEITVEEVAALMDTITYEVTCLVTRRVARRHTS